MKRKILWLALLLSLLGSLPAYSQQQGYYVTEEQLQELEANSKKQEEYVRILEEQRDEIQKSLKKSENKKYLELAEVAVVFFTIGFITSELKKM